MTSKPPSLNKSPKPKPKRVKRANRKVAAANAVGGAEYGGRWFPTVTMDQWFAARRSVPAYHRGGFKAWARSERVPNRQTPSNWDGYFRRYQAADI